MFKLVLEKAEEQEIKLPTSAGSSEKSPATGLKESYKTSNSACMHAVEEILYIFMYRNHLGMER